MVLITSYYITDSPDPSLECLKDNAVKLVESGICRSTRRTYTSAQSRYVTFCDTYGLQVFPASEETVLLFLSLLSNNKLKPASIRVYVSAVSDSYQGYIRAPRQVLASFSKRMVNKNQGICHHNRQASNYVTNSI